MNDTDAVSAERRNFLKQCAGATLAAASVPVLAIEAGKRNARLPPAHRRMLIIDTLGELADPNQPEWETKGPDLGVNARVIDDTKASGLCALNLTIGYVFGKEDPFEQSVRDIGAWDALIRRKSESLLRVYNAKDIRRAQASGKIGVIYGFQNSAMMGSDAKRVALFANLGVRIIQLTYNVRNQVGDGSMVPENQGLTEFGREVVHELNRNRVLVDLAHSGENTCLEAAAVSATPIIVSHTGCRAITDLPRNKTDKELRLVAEKGGYVGIYFMPFLAIGRQPMAEDLIAHIEHAVQVCGEDHVGIGSDGGVPDIDNMPAYMEQLRKEVEHRRTTGIGAAGERGDIVKFLPDLNGPQKYHRLAILLAARGHSSARIEKILGGNFLRVAEQIW